MLKTQDFFNQIHTYIWFRFFWIYSSVPWLHECKKQVLIQNAVPKTVLSNLCLCALRNSPWKTHWTLLCWPNLSKQIMVNVCIRKDLYTAHSKHQTIGEVIDSLPRKMSRPLWDGCTATRTHIHTYVYIYIYV